MLLIYDPGAVYDPASSGNNQKVSPNGKKVLWARGNGWAMAALARVLEDLPDDREEDRLEYETTFKKMAETLIQVQGEDGFWRMNLDDHAHDIRPETSGTVFFAYGLTWGINHGLLDKETYYPAVRKAFLGLNANAFRPDGLVGRSELISAYPNPNCSLGIGSSQSYAPAAAVLFLSELSKLESQGYVRDDVEPALNKRMIGAVAVKEGSPDAVVNSRVTTLDETGTMTAIAQDGKTYVPLSFLSAIYGEERADGLSDIILHEGEEYAALNDVCGQENRILSSIKDGIAIVSYKEQLFDPVIDAKLTALLDQGLSDGRYPERPEYEIRFDYTPPAQTPKPADDALISVGSSTSGAVSASREIGPSTDEEVTLSFDMISVLSPNQTNAIVGIGSSDSAYTAYSQVPIIIRMYKDGCFGAYDGNGYVQSSVKFAQNEKYRLEVRIDLHAGTYDVVVTSPDGAQTQIADDFAFRSTAQQPDDIGKIYLFNNDQAEGRYWIEHITSEERLRPSNDALISVESSTSGAISASREIGPSTSKRMTVSFDAVTTLPADQTNAIIGIGAAGSDYHAYAQVPIVIRMFNDGYFSVYDGTRFVRSDVRHAANTKYSIRAGIDLERQTYSVYVTLPDGTEQQIAQDFAFRATAQAPAAIGKIYLFNNDQEAGRYWLENITLTDEQEHADKEALNAAIERAEALDETAYTAESWAAIQEALNAAKTVAADAQADQAAVDAAEQALTSAIGALEKVSEPAGDAAVQALRDMVDKAIALGAEDEALNEAIANAQAVLAKETPTATEVVSALLDLSEAMQALNIDESTDALRADVQATIDFINENILNNVEGLRPGKLQALKDAVAASEELLASEDATVDELKAANRAMTKAAQELWEIVAKTELNALIEAANGYLDGSYTAESLEALQAAIDAAQAAAINDDATTAEVTDAITNLSSAIAGLESIKLDTSALEHEVELVSEMIANLDNYVPSSVEGLQEKLDAAKTVLSNATTQAEIDEATKTLREARLNARTKADTSTLEEIIAYAISLDLAGYTAESRNMLDRTIVAVKRVLADPEATQEEVDQAVQTMQTAIDSLQLVENSTGSTTVDTTNTAAAAQTAAFAGMLAVSAAAILMVNKRRRRA